MGISLAQHLVDEGHNVTMIDRSEAVVQKTMDTMDAMFIHGSGVSAVTLKEADVQRADIVIAATMSDEVNMLACLTAKRLGAQYTIARIRDPEYLHQTEFLRDALGIDFIVNPEYECAREISRILRFPSAARVVTFSKGSLEIVEHRIAEGTALCGLRISDMGKRFRANVLVALIESNFNPAE